MVKYPEHEKLAAQKEAHEAVRPTSVARTPDSLKAALDEDQYKLYSLIWKRTMACQMIPAVFDTVAIEMAAGPEDAGHRFRANGSVLVVPGFIDDSKASSPQLANQHIVAQPVGRWQINGDRGRCVLICRHGRHRGLKERLPNNPSVIGKSLDVIVRARLLVRTPSRLDVDVQQIAKQILSRLGANGLQEIFDPRRRSLLPLASKVLADRIDLLEHIDVDSILA